MTPVTGIRIKIMVNAVTAIGRVSQIHMTMALRKIARAYQPVRSTPDGSGSRLAVISARIVNENPNPPAMLG